MGQIITHFELLAMSTLRFKAKVDPLVYMLDFSHLHPCETPANLLVVSMVFFLLNTLPTYFFNQQLDLNPRILVLQFLDDRHCHRETYSPRDLFVLRLQVRKGKVNGSVKNQQPNTERRNWLNIKFIFVILNYEMLKSTVKSVTKLKTCSNVNFYSC